MKKRLVMFAALLFSVSFAGLLTNVVNAQDGGERIKARIAKSYEMREQKMKIGNGEVGSRQVKICVDFYTVDWTEFFTDQHLEEGDRILLVGPNPVSDIWQVTPVGPGHPWAPGHYQAFPTTDPNMFDLWFVNVKPHNGEAERGHYYRMEVDGWADDGCPEYVVFHSLAHFGEGISLHPGHAGAGR